VELCVLDEAGRAGDRCTVEDVLVGDVWILAGQSNMQGVGLLKHRLPPVDAVRAFYMDDRWAPAEDPIHNLDAAVDSVHVELSGGTRPQPARFTGVGPGVAFGQDMFEATGVPQGLIACAHGGTSMEQWDPALKRLGSRSLYGAMLRRFQKNGSRVAGVVWYQGESDANAEAAPHYTRRMKRLVRAMRRDFGQPSLPVVIVQIARVVGWPGTPEHWNSVQEQQRLLPQVIERLATVPAIDLPLSDTIHISAAGQHRLGRRLAGAMRVLTQGRRAGKPPIELKSLSVRTRRHDGLADLVVEFANVQGRLCAGSRPAGFSLCDPEPSHAFYDVELDGPRAIIHTALPSADVEGMRLHYGRGFDPYCNVVDEADRSLPVFGPVAVGAPRARTGFVRRFLVSPFRPADARLESVGCPGALAELGLERREFPERFCARVEEIRATRGSSGLYYYGCRLHCPERMKLRALLGYDGPVKVCLDGAEVFHDPEGTNPASPADAEVPLGTLAAGTHELLIALGNNQGNAWGIFLRFERPDVSPARVMRGPDAYVMPSVEA